MSIQIVWRNSLALCFVILFLLCSYAFNQNSLSQAETHSQWEGSYKLRVDVNLVTTDIAVMGKIVPDFTRDDFIVYDNNVVQPLSYFSQHFSQDQLPIAVVFLLATNGSFVGGKPQIESPLTVHHMWAASALRQLKSEDQVVLYSFLNGHYLRLSDLTEDRMKIAKAHTRLFEKNPPNIYSTINKAIKYLKENYPHRRRAIILISDSMLDPVGTRDRDSARNARISRTRLLESSTILCDTVFVPSDSKSSWSKSDAAIREMAEESGGEVIEVKRPLSITAALENAITNLQMQYTLGFNPSDRGLDGQFHNLKVRFADENRCPDCRIIGRFGYYSGIGVSTPLPLPNKAERKSP
jgi:VWFA-related protein